MNLSDSPKAVIKANESAGFLTLTSFMDFKD